MEEYYDNPNEPVRVGFMFSFKTMSEVIQRIEEETGDYDEHYPKRDLLKIWANCILLIFVLACLSYSILIVATLPFIFFYCFVLFRLMGAWKRFKYPRAGFAAITFLTVSAVILVGFALQGLIFN